MWKGDGNRMRTFLYEAMNQAGQEVKDEMEAETPIDALDKIRNLGYFPTRIRAKNDGAEIGACVDELLRVNTRAILAILSLIVVTVILLVGVPLVFWWNHDDFTCMQVFKATWITTLLGLLSLCGSTWALIWWWRRQWLDAPS